MMLHAKINRISAGRVEYFNALPVVIAVRSSGKGRFQS